MQIFSAIVLICTTSFGEPKCESVKLPELFNDIRDCMRAIHTYDIANSKKLYQQTKYVISGSCMKWHVQRKKYDLQYTALESMHIISISLAGRYRPKLTSALGK